MKTVIAIILLVLLLIAGAVYYFYPTLYGIVPRNTNTQKLTTLPSPQADNPNQSITTETIIAEGLDTPWAIAFLPARNASHSDAGGPDGNLLVTERKGTVRLVNQINGLQDVPVATLSNVKEIGEGGLLGITLHPDFSSNNYVYLYYTYSNKDGNTLNRVVRMKYNKGQLTDEQVIVDSIPGASNHNGGRIKFGPDRNLYITTGDAQEPSLAQDKNSLAGKILKVTDPSTSSGQARIEIFSIGHRNPQGIAWDGNGNLWETEHGPSGGSLGTGNDEVNLIQTGNNYGWPVIQGDQTKEGMITPVRNSTPSVTWAPAGAAFINNSLFFGGLRNQALYEAVTQNNQITDFKEHFKGKYGRIREVVTGPDGMLYITTSNQDGRGVPKPEDDRIIRVNPSKL